MGLLLLACFVLHLAFLVCSSISIEEYLKRFGYNDGLKYSHNIDLAKSISSYQATFGLQVTGFADEATLKLMNTPGCGVSDNIKALRDTKWNKNDLSYRFDNYTPDLPRNQVRSVTQKAFKYWSNVTPLKFTEKSINQYADIVLHFGKEQHGEYYGKNAQRICLYPFDGPGKVLAHAFFPPNGRLHYDDAETYTVSSPNGTNYEWVATHELGHILGLEHDTQNKDAVMYPYYRPYNPNGMKLHENDIKRIQAQYGKNTGPGPRTTFSTKQTTKTPSTTKSKTTKTMSPTTNTSCSDRFADCKDRKSFCRLPAWEPFLKAKQSCGYCTACEDSMALCRRLKKRCNKANIKRKCPKTCNTC